MSSSSTSGIARRLFYPVFVLGRAIPLFWLAWHFSGPRFPGITLGFIVASILLLLWAERRIPYREDWRVRGDSQIWNDLGHAVAYIFVGGQLGRVLFVAIPLALFGSSETRMWDGIWPHAWPLGYQIALVILLADGLEYAYHRATHTVPWLWHLHVLHHTPDRLNVLKNFRQQWTYSMVRSLVSSLPLLLLGAPVVLLLWFSVAASVIGVTVHANVDMRVPRFLHRVLNTPALHRIHHSKDPAHHNANFAFLLPIWDILFGTFKAPEDETVVATGLVDDPVPAGFLKQLALPLTMRRAG